ncbi:MAG: hypothetical protein HYR88_02610 [Verrucomicrobia bacterium]|nr:hypothetical protein [Verrucomicrobiota bacterium]MBI3867604.1 hypothetical protein [Verrucomicrobiota bacterium]
MIIPLFISYFTPGSGRGSLFKMSGEDIDLGRLNGEPITLAQFQDAQREAVFRMRFYTDRNSDHSAEQLREFAYQVLLIGQQIKEHGIHPSQEAVARVALSFGVPDIGKFLESMPKEQGVRLQKEDFVRFLEHEAGFRELTQLITSGTQLISPREVDEKFRKENQEMVVDAVFFNAPSYTNTVALTAEAIARYYTNYQSNYRLEERLQVAYAAFPKTNYFPQADQKLAAQTNLAAILNDMYQRQGATNFVDPNNPAVLLSEKDAKEKIKADVRGQIALTAAYNAASAVADKMMSDTNRSAKYFESYLAAAKIPTATSSPFEHSFAPVEFKGVSAEFASRAFRLTNVDDAILFTPIMGEDAVYLTAVKRQMPSQVEPLEVVRSRVTGDYLRSQGRDLATQAGTAFYASLTNQLAAGKSFTEAAAASRLKVEALPPFSLGTDSLPELEGRADLPQLKNAVQSLANGAVSRFIYTRDGGMVARLRERRALADEVRKEKYTAFLQREKSTKANDSLMRWFQKVEQDKLQRPAETRAQGSAPQGKPAAAKKS